MTHAGSESFRSAVKKSWFETADQPRALNMGAGRSVCLRRLQKVYSCTLRTLEEEEFST